MNAFENLTRILFQSMDLQERNHLASSAVQNILQLHAKYRPVSRYFPSSIGKLLLSNSFLIQIQQNLPPAPAASKLTAWPEHTPVPQCALPSVCLCSLGALGPRGRGSQTALPSLCGRLREQHGHPPSPAAPPTAHSQSHSFSLQGKMAS